MLILCQRTNQSLSKKYESLLKKPDAKESEFDETERKLSEDVHESEEGLT